MSGLQGREGISSSRPPLISLCLSSTDAYADARRTPWASQEGYQAQVDTNGGTSAPAPKQSMHGTAKPHVVRGGPLTNTGQQTRGKRTAQPAAARHPRVVPQSVSALVGKTARIPSIGPQSSRTPEDPIAGTNAHPWPTGQRRESPYRPRMCRRKSPAPNPNGANTCMYAFTASRSWFPHSGDRAGLVPHVAVGLKVRVACHSLAEACVSMYFSLPHISPHYQGEGGGLPSIET